MECDQREDHAHDADDGFAHRPGLHRLPYAETQAVLHHPEPAVIQMTEEQGSATNGTDDQCDLMGIEFWVCRHDWNKEA